MLEGYSIEYLVFNKFEMQEQLEHGKQSFQPQEAHGLVQGS